jgi:hypothetical protein
MEYLPCEKRSFPYRINIQIFYASYLRWMRQLSERLGSQNARSIWKNTFTDYDDTLLMRILSSGWHYVDSIDANQVEEEVAKLVGELFSTPNQEISVADARNMIEETPPIFQIKRLFSHNTVEKEISAYEALHLRFDGLASLAETLIDRYRKQGELIIYDLMVEGRLASSEGETGSVEEFIEYFTAKPIKPTIFDAGLETELISKTENEVVLYVRKCEWARYFRERHPNVGYLMSCSTDEVAYKAFNKNLRLQRTHTLMEGSDKCDFRIYAIDEKSNPEG